MRYGLFDTIDQLWLGDEHGPKTFGPDDVAPNGQPLGDNALIVARCAAEAACFTVGWDPTRVQVRELPDQPWRLRDEIAKTRTELQWVKGKERGSII